jgi:antirestriction protein
MTPGHERQGGESQDQPRPEREPKARPRIYVASLSDYNTGRLHGAWIDAAHQAEQLHDEVAAMLERSPEPGAEEWAIHDYEGFGPLRLSEYESLERIGVLAEGIAEHGPAFAHWIALTASDEADPSQAFEDLYLGHWSSLDEYAEHLLADLGYDELLERGVPENLRPYVSLDFAAYARDLEFGGDIVVSKGDGGVYVFGTQ